MQFQDTYLFKFLKSALPNYESISVRANVFTSDESKMSQARTYFRIVGAYILKVFLIWLCL